MPVVETAHQRTANTKNQILENARELFAEHGYDGTSIRQLTATLNITPAALYYHFASKNDVLEGLAAKLHDGSDDLLKRISEFWARITSRPIMMARGPMSATAVIWWHQWHAAAALQRACVSTPSRKQSEWATARCSLILWPPVMKGQSASGLS